MKPKMKQPVPLRVIYPPSLTHKPKSSSKEPEDTPMSPQTSGKRTRESKKPSTHSTKKMKVTHYSNAEELSKEMSVGFGLDKEWYESTIFPKFHEILQTQKWESLMSVYCCNPIYPDIMHEFISNFAVHDGVCSSSIKDIDIEFDSLTLGEWLGVPATGFDVYHVGSKIAFSGRDEKDVWRCLGVRQKRGKVSHNVLSPLHKLLYNIARRFILPRNSKRSEVSLRDATLIYCMVNNIKINFPSLMISHLNDCIAKRCMVGYGGLLSWIFSKFGVPLGDYSFPMGPSNMIGAKCLSNLRLKLNEEGILENIVEQIEIDSDNEEQEEEGKEKEEQEEEEEKEEKEQEKKEEEEKEEQEKEGDGVKEQEVVPSEEEDQGVESKVSLEEDSRAEPNSFPSSKPTTPPTHHFTPPLPSPTPRSPSPSFHKHSFDQATVPTAPLYSILLKLDDLQDRFFKFQDEIRVSLASLADQMTQMEARLGAKLDTVEVETEYVDEDAPAS